MRSLVGEKWNYFIRVAILILLYSGIICYDSLNIISLDTVIGIYGGLFHSLTTHNFALFLCIIRAIVLIPVYYPRRSKKSMGATGRKMSSFLLTQYTGNCFYLFKNNLIKMWEQFRILEFLFIILLIGGIFLISSSDLVFKLSTIAGLSSFFGLTGLNPVLLAAIVPIKSYSNAEADKDKILSDNKNKSGIYKWKNNLNGKQYIGSAIDLSKRLSKYYSTTYMEYELNRGLSHIYRALLKNGYENFSLTILE